MREIASPLSGPFTTFGQTPIDIYKVGAYRPELAYSFYNEYYRRGRQPVNLLEAITHTRNGNATMTGEYGPELVTNGDFSDGSTGWDSGPSVTATYVDGALQFVGAGSLSSTAGYWVSQDINLEENKAYEVSYDAVISSGSSFRVGHGYNQIAQNSQNGSFKHQFTAINNFSRWDELTFSADSGAILTIDNISVREVPKIQWAPHNLLTYSEDFSNAAWVKTATTVTANAAVAPDGTQTADEISHTSTSAACQQTPPSLPTVEHTLGVYLKYIDHQWVRLFNNTNAAWFDIQNGVVGTDVSGTAFITDVGNGWYYVGHTQVNDGTEVVNFTLVTADGSTTEISGTSAYIWGAHLYRSDLGGMADVPASERVLPTATKYVPTTDAARYLPRVNHHVYNGSQWVNKGLLVERKARTNLLLGSLNEGTTNWSVSEGTTTVNATTSPDGQSNAVKLIDTLVDTSHYLQSDIVTISAGAVTGSVFLKAAEYGFGRLRFEGTSGLKRAWFDLTSGTISGVDTGALATIEEAGNGWYRCSLSEPNNTASGAVCRLQIFTQTSGAFQTNYAGDGTSGIYIWGAQLEAGSKPSSLIPTSGSSVTRPAESITIPAANLPWPDPVHVTNEELVTNGTFDADTDWTKPTGWTISGGLASYDGTGVQYNKLYQTLSGLTVGAVYEITFTVSGVSGDGSVNFGFGNSVGNTLQAPQATYGSDGTYTRYMVASIVDHSIILQCNSATQTITIDNISVKEINPLALSIQMKGEMTYADEDASSQHSFYRWRLDANNRLNAELYTNSTNDGTIIFDQSSSGVYDSVSSGEVLSPDVNVPFNIASRHGSTFVNGAVDGVALTADTTPVALPDLSATDLELAYDFMGTISLFRMWADDLGDTGIEDATEPSTEATLFLSFDGTENSYVNFDWSE